MCLGAPAAALRLWTLLAKTAAVLYNRGRIPGSPGVGEEAERLKSRALRWGVLIVLLAGWQYIAWNVPYTYDDWD